MREIILSGGRAVALIDDVDAPIVEPFTWQVREMTFGGNRHHVYRYACRKADGRTLMLHRAIMQPPAGMVVDHINGDGLDNRRENLRIATRKQNAQNRRKHKPTSSRFIGVYWHRYGKRWVAEIRGEHLGMFTSEEAAARAYDAAARSKYGEFASLNFDAA